MRGTAYNKILNGSLSLHLNSLLVKCKKSLERELRLGVNSHPKLANAIGQF